MSSLLSARRVAPLLLGSGFCSLVYQIGWLREFRLVFGASTAASAAVLAIFIGGLGVGAWLLGRRADAATRPLMLYGNLELVIAATAALSPLLLAGIRELYIATGGSFALGLPIGTGLRLVLAALVLAVPTIAMGGTLAAATRAITGAGDERRRSLALLYGTNTIGAVLGALIATFFLLEILGTRKTIWVAALLNALIALFARSMARGADEVVPSRAAKEPAVASDGALPRWFVLVAAGVAGFAFFLMEMTWYRMLGPILGGTVFTFGLILAVALVGLGVGGLLYSLRSASRAATVHGLVWTCVLEAIGLAIPLALGDSIAFGASSLRSLSVLGFGGQVLAWTAIAALVILPAAIASGIQFPLLVNLVGRGQHDLGRQLGLVYAANTIGAIAGSLLGGFVLLPALGAVGCWRLTIVLLLALGVAALAFVIKSSTRRQLIPIGATLAIVVPLLIAEGPTAVWRHSGIGAGRAATPTNPTEAAAYVSSVNRRLVWEAEGVESSVGLTAENGMSFVVNGKVDGNVQRDAPTQMMGGIVGALIHPTPKRGLVIGLGTGETAGWLADAPGVERVDVVELEPAILEVARRCAPANRNVMANPKVHVMVGDAREAVLVADATYDVVFSEPSNPYRAGVASLYTREFYEAVSERLGEGGLFLQWTQAYEIDGTTLASVYATLVSVFTDVHTFRLGPGDMLFVASRSPIRYDVARIAERVKHPVVHSALSYAWWVEGTEGFLSHFVGDHRLAAAVAEGAVINTDDRTSIEFGFARALGLSVLQNATPLRRLATSLSADYPPLVGTIDRARFDELRAFADTIGRSPPIMPPSLTPDHRARIDARTAYANGNLGGAAAAWKRQSAPPASHYDTLMVAEVFAAIGEEAPLTALRPAEAAFVRARLNVAKKQWAAAATELVAGYDLARGDILVGLGIIGRAVQLAQQIGQNDPTQARALVTALAKPFMLYAQNESRLNTQLHLAATIDDATFAAALAPYEPHVPWELELLVKRKAAYSALKHEYRERAEDDVLEFLSGKPMPLIGPPTGEPASAPVPTDLE